MRIRAAPNYTTRKTANLLCFPTQLGTQKCRKRPVFLCFSTQLHTSPAVGHQIFSLLCSIALDVLKNTCLVRFATQPRGIKMVTQAQSLDIETLEAMVDRHGLDGVLSMLSEICAEKAEHIEANWQDDGSTWMARSELLDAACSKVLDT